MSMAVVVEFAGIVGFAIVIVGGKQARTKGWKVIFAILAACIACQVSAISIISSLHKDDDHFFPGWYLAKCFGLATASWAIQVIIAAVLVACAFLLPEEGGYELIPDRERSE